MPLVLTCPRGHRVELPTDVGAPTVDWPMRCPECGDEIARPTASGEADAGVPTRADATPPEAPPTPPALAGYGEFELVGQGGMGVVFRARHLHLDRTVAVKVLPVDSQSPALAERFIREARALARLSHPNITAVHDFGQLDGQSYIVMEFVEGSDLRDRLRAGPVPSAEARSVALQVCDALQYAHEEGVIHRDIKPENILLDRRGRVKVADFGIAKLLTGGPGSQTLTHTQQVMGTLHYMAPEQLEGARDVDHRADLYAVGVLLYEMLTGRRPLGRFPPPSEAAGVDPRFDPIVLKALERDPERRYPNAAAMKTVLEQMEESPNPAVARAIPFARLAAEENPFALTDVVQALPKPASASLWPMVIPGILTILIGVGHLAVLVSLLQDSHRWRQELTAVLLVDVALPVYGAFLILAGFAAMRGQRYRLVMAAGFAMMLPQPAWPISFLLGLWMVLTMRRRAVREAFRQQEEARRVWGEDPRRALLGSGTTWVVFFLMAAFLELIWPWTELTLLDAELKTPSLRVYSGYGAVPGWLVAVAAVGLAGVVFFRRFDRVVSLPRAGMLLGFGAVVGLIGLLLVLWAGSFGLETTLGAPAAVFSRRMELYPLFRQPEVLHLNALPAPGNLVEIVEMHGENWYSHTQVKLPRETFGNDLKFRERLRLVAGGGGYVVALLGLLALALGAVDLWLQRYPRRMRTPPVATPALAPTPTDRTVAD